MMKKLFALAVALVPISHVGAQTSAGSLVYAPITAAPGSVDNVQAVPLPVVLLVALGASLLLLGARNLRRYGRHHSFGLLLALCGTVTLVSSGVYTQSASALAAIINLSNPAGDTINLPTGGFELVNTSGVDLVIDSIDVASGCTSNTPTEECLSGTALAPLESCFTDYQCTPPPIDTDGDGFLDDVDACPTQGDQGYGVDGTGCPNPVPDSDGDGVPDNVDGCPAQGDQGYGVDGTGCPNPVPDSDGDGFPDNVDACPAQGDQGYGVDGTGCPNPVPDSDGDGVPDNVDACPAQGDQGDGVDGTGCPNVV